MINKQLLLNKLEDNQIQGILDKTLESPIQSGTSRIEYNPTLNCLELYGEEGKMLIQMTVINFNIQVG